MNVSYYQYIDLPLLYRMHHKISGKGMYSKKYIYILSACLTFSDDGNTQSFGGIILFNSLLHQCVCALIVTLCLRTGAGIYVTNSQLTYSSSSLPNNSIILADTSSGNYYSRYRRMGFYCCSNYSSAGQYGTFIGLNSNTYSGRITVSRDSIGCMNLYFYKPYYSYGNLLETSEQGIYTCRIPDATGRNIDVSVGIYNEDYNSKLVDTAICC